MATFLWTGHKTRAATTDAILRTQLLSWHNAMLACGLVQAGDTGQINFSTVTRPVAGGQPIGNLVYRFNDALQSTAPVFLLVKVYTFVDASSWGFIFNAAPATDGACGPSASGPPAYCYGMGDASGAENTTIRISGDGSRICLIAQPIEYYQHLGFVYCLERSKDNNGVDTNEGLQQFHQQRDDGGGVYKETPRAAFIQFTPFTASNNAMNGCQMPLGSTGSLPQNKVAVYPFRAFLGGEKAPPLGILGYFKADLYNRTPVGIACYDGQLHTYIPLGGNYDHSASDGTTPGANAILMRWE